MTYPKPEKLLHNERMYLASDRIVCGRVRCAGSSAAYTGVTTGGARVSALRVEDVAAWSAMGLGPMACECGRMQAQITEGRMEVVTT